MNGGIQRILLIEDDLYTRDLYKESLESGGFSVETAVDGLDGLDKIETGGYGLIVLDAMLPKIDGLTLLGKVKDITPKQPNGPILLFTNLVRNAILPQAIASGAADVLVKAEVNPDQLVEKARELIK